MLDLVTYYPYIIGIRAGGYVQISSESYVDREERERLEYGTPMKDFNIFSYYRRELAEEYARVYAKMNN